MTKHVVVVGAGVLGITSALELRRKGYKVTVLAREIPWDVTSQSFASPWAGANWCSFANTKEAERRRDAITYKRFKEFEKELPPHVLVSMPFTCYDVLKDDWDQYWFGDVCGGVEQVENHGNKVATEAPYAYKFTSFTLDAPTYLQWLAGRLLGKDEPGPPAKLVRVSTLTSLRQAALLVPDTDLIINATGLGSQDVAESADKDMYPIRGQTVLVWAPRIQNKEEAHCVSMIGKNGASYVIPRARSGRVILGGTFHARQSNPLTPDPAVTERILKDAVQLAPELLPKDVDPSSPDAWKHIEVIRVNIGVRPAREGGARVALDSTPMKVHGKRVGIIHAYGIGPAGYQASYGIAAEVCELAELWENGHGSRAARL